MSLSEQAFVKAFARRNRISTNRPASLQRHTQPSAQPVAGADPQHGAPAAPSPARVWMNPITDQIARADEPTATAPRPHVEPQVSSPAVQASPRAEQQESSLQHIHTAYATAISEIAPPPAETVPSTTVPSTTVPSTTVPSTARPLPGARPGIGETEESVVRRADAGHQIAPPTSHRKSVGSTAQVADAHRAPIDSLQSIAPFQAVWEVDVFDVPSSVAELFFEGRLFQQIAERMSDAVTSGLNSVLVTSTTAGEGRSSVAIGLAMASAAAGIRVALVDADTEHPTLADDLRLDLQYGWADTIRGGLPIKEIAVHAVEDGVTLIPLMPPHGQTAATAYEVVQLVELLKNKFELVVVDGPSGSSTSLHQCASVVDSAIIVRDVTRTNTLAINEFSYRLRESGVHGVGVVENFV